jgi:dihydropteroate synthase-like protein
MAEVVGIEHLSDEEILKQATYLKRSGADILDLGIMQPLPERVEEVIELLKPLGVPLSVDTMEARNLEAAIDAGADLLLSFDHELLREFSGVEIPSVVIPRRGREVPNKPEQRVKLLEENIALAEEQGFKRIIADPLLSPLNFGFTESVEAYRRFGKRHPERVMLFGLGNVSELLDADSTGVNALLAGIASEVGASILFTPEASGKTRGSVRELSIAAKMMFLAKRRKSLPKDLGISLLVCKEKRIRRDPMPEEVKRARKVKAKRSTTYTGDKKGYFKIYVDDTIYCAHFRDGRLNLVVTGESAKDIGDTLLRLDLIGELSHALYLGRELQRAEEALRFGRSYVQR